MLFTFDPRKDTANILKHGISLSDAPLVFNAPDKLTLVSKRNEESRWVDLAMVETRWDAAGVEGADAGRNGHSPARATAR